MKMNIRNIIHLMLVTFLLTKSPVFCSPIAWREDQDKTMKISKPFFDEIIKHAKSNSIPKKFLEDIFFKYKTTIENESNIFDDQSIKNTANIVLKTFQNYIEQFSNKDSFTLYEWNKILYCLSSIRKDMTMLELSEHFEKNSRIDKLMNIIKRVDCDRVKSFYDQDSDKDLYLSNLDNLELINYHDLPTPIFDHKKYSVLIVPSPDGLFGIQTWIYALLEHNFSLLGSNYQSLTDAHGCLRDNYKFLRHDISHTQLMREMMIKSNGPRQLNYLKSIHGWASGTLSTDDFRKHLVFMFVLLNEYPALTTSYTSKDDTSILDSLSNLNNLKIEIKETLPYNTVSQIHLLENEINNYFHKRIENCPVGSNISIGNQIFKFDHLVRESLPNNLIENVNLINSKTVSFNFCKDTNIEEITEGVKGPPSLTVKTIKNFSSLYRNYYNQKDLLDTVDLAQLLNFAGYNLPIVKKSLNKYDYKVKFDKHDASLLLNELITHVVDLWKKAPIAY